MCKRTFYYFLGNNKLASLEATLVRNSADPLTDSLTGVKCRATSVAKKYPEIYILLPQRLLISGKFKRLDWHQVKIGFVIPLF